MVESNNILSKTASAYNNSNHASSVDYSVDPQRGSVHYRSEAFKQLSEAAYGSIPPNVKKPIIGKAAGAVGRAQNFTEKHSDITLTLTYGGLVVPITLAASKAMGYMQNAGMFSSAKEMLEHNTLYVVAGLGVAYCLALGGSLLVGEVVKQELPGKLAGLKEKLDREYAALGSEKI